jgi:hypothetical protein
LMVVKCRNGSRTAAPIIGCRDRSSPNTCRA